MLKELKVGIVGCGNIADAHIADSETPPVTAFDGVRNMEVIQANYCSSIA